MRRSMVLLFGLLLAWPALGQAPVGRLAEASGPVSALGPGGWVPLARGAGLIEGVAVRTGPRSQAELDLGANRIGLDPDTVLRIDSGNPAAPVVSVEQGRAMLLLRSLQPGQAGRVALGEVAVSLVQPGLYVVEAADGGRAAHVGVTRGLAQAFGPGVSVMVPAGRTAMLGAPPRLLDFVAEGFLADDPSAPMPQVVRPGAMPPPGAGGVPPEVAELPGGEVLGREGSWGEAPEVGAVWYPPVAPGWSPYGDAWSERVAWGHVPWHYGTWMMIGPRWGWVPPPRHHRTPVGYGRPPAWRGYPAPAMAQPHRPPPAYHGGARPPYHGGRPIAPPPPQFGGRSPPPAAPHVFAPRPAAPPVSAGLPPPRPVAPASAAPHVFAPRPAAPPISAMPPPMARPQMAAPAPPRPMAPPPQRRCGVLGTPC